MAQEQHGNRGGNSYGHGSSHSGGYRGHGGGSYGGHRGGFHKGGGHGGYRGNDHRDGGHRDFHRDGERGGYRHDGERRDFHGHRDFHKDGERGGYRGNGGGRDFHRDDRRGGYRHDDRRDFHRDGDRRDFHKDGERGGYRHDNDRRDFHRDGGQGGYRGNGGGRGGYRGRDDRRDFHRDGERGGYRSNGDDRRDFHRDDRRGGRDGYRSGGYQGRRDDRRGGGYRGRDDRRDGGRRDFRRDDRRDFKRDDRRSDRRDFHRDDRRDDRRGGFYDNGRRAYMENGPRRNSDGTMSFPSQNPYTDRRPGEPRMPKGMEWSMLSKDEKERLRGLSKEHAENIGLHILAAYALEESDPKAALDHAKWVARQASRIDFARETLAFIAYRQGDYKTALREFRTAQRMNGYDDYTPFIADCERGLGNPKKAVEIALSDEAKELNGEAKAELFLVYAGALGDLGLWDKAIEVVHKLGTSKGLPGAYRMRALQAEQYFLEEAGRGDEAADLDPVLEKLEQRYADVDEDDEDAEEVVIDYDLERLPDDMMEELGITEDDSQYAPEEPEDEYDDEYRDDDYRGDDSEQDDDSDRGDDGEDHESDQAAEAATEAKVEQAVAQVAGDELDTDAVEDDQSATALDPETAEAEESAAGTVAEDPEGFEVASDPAEKAQEAEGQAERSADADETVLPAVETDEGVDSPADPIAHQDRVDAKDEAGDEE
ncbi:helicase [Bifidobacterium sp. ESL0790]|uniref:tetratricopeptide repeat protein n=1 Tax=Bifidobacterium sp. ESL0790 TaxID=2983233 RepID=UPI0023F9D3E5|nr:helicase [Bifidobacterium sp. ESL0790]WEV71796.1 helicase [Bifidobacterium sp. ESL0790]